MYTKYCEGKDGEHLVDDEKESGGFKEVIF
jgi:hypothetical protein